MQARFALAGAAVAIAASLAPLLQATAAEYRGVSVDAAVLYDGPSDRAQKRFVVVRGTPLELVSTLNPWAKVRDLDGDVLWIRANELSEPRYVVVSRALASVRRSPAPVGELLFQAERGVLLEVLDDSAPAGWLNVRHPDGTRGFVASSEVFGR